MNDGYAGRAIDMQDRMTEVSAAPTCLYNFNRFAKVGKTARRHPFLIGDSSICQLFPSAGKKDGGLDLFEPAAAAVGQNKKFLNMS